MASITYEVTVFENRTEWRLDGKLHREDGPAVEYANGDQCWYINGQWMTEEQHQERTQSVKELTVADIEKLLGYSVKIVK